MLQYVYKPHEMCTDHASLYQCWATCLPLIYDNVMNVTTASPRLHNAAMFFISLATTGVLQAALKQQTARFNESQNIWQIILTAVTKS